MNRTDAQSELVRLYLQANEQLSRITIRGIDRARFFRNIVDPYILYDCLLYDAQLQPKYAFAVSHGRSRPVIPLNLPCSLSTPEELPLNDFFLHLRHLSDDSGSSLDNNPPNADRHITPGGSDWLWAVFAIMALADLGMVMWSVMRPRGTRFFHNIAIVILTTATIAYFAMASDLGATPVVAEFSRGNTFTRQIWVCISPSVCCK
ncbi:hypothetical protein NM688_g7990 [Phlebia brevispora]|uniref:Uncharacterized protein n=1 Tax=Phlebia brevispora TaxID=194682 RepID=A0ACC1RYV6_9APHY|nr:hypothetical protein NM688_g7990 [Phlebia brevispora]